MLAGAEKYGLSWCEVNLKADIIEELVDIWNYLNLMELRIKNRIDLAPDFSMTQRSWVVKMRRLVLEALESTDTLCPEFEGPTSAEWVKQREVVEE